MQRYKNLNGNSGVAAYLLNEDAIIVEFVDGGLYLYNHEAPGRQHVEQMKRLAEEGRGLSTYIATHVRSRYAHRLR